LGSRAAATLLAGVALVGVTACGDDDTASTATSQAPTTATAPGSEDQPGGGGDEQGAVVSATFSFSGSGVTPTSVRVPAFFGIRVTGVSRDGHPHTIVFQGRTVPVPADGRASATVAGLKAGEYPVEIDGSAGAAKIVASADRGP
jgi:hypothetical protein